jgi:lysophospholipase L1-like esterase
MGWNKGNQSIADFGREHAKEDNEVLLGQYIESISQNDLGTSTKTHVELMIETRQYRQKTWARSALLLQHIATRFNIPIVHVLQPVLLPGVKTLTPLETSYGFDQNVRQSYPDYDSYIKELRLLGVRIHDFRNVFVDFSGDAFIDTVHLTEAGNKIMSDGLIEVIEASLPATLQTDDRAPSKIDWSLLYK